MDLVFRELGQTSALCVHQTRKVAGGRVQAAGARTGAPDHAQTHIYVSLCEYFRLPESFTRHSFQNVPGTRNSSFVDFKDMPYGFS